MTDHRFTYRLATPLSPADRHIANLSVKPENAREPQGHDEPEAAAGDNDDEGAA